MIDSPEQPKQPPSNKPAREKASLGKKIRNTAAAVLTTAALGAGATVARDSYLNWPSSPVENPEPFPSINLTPNDTDFFNLSSEDKYKYWTDHEPQLTETRTKVEDEVLGFLTRVMGHSSPGRGNGPSISRRIIDYDTDWNGHRDMSASWSFTENDLQEGVLEDHASFKIWNDDGTRSNNYGLGVEIKGLLMSQDRQSYDLANSDISFVRITDGDAKILDGRKTVLEFTKNPNGGFDLKILREDGNGRLSSVFDSSLHGVDINKTSPGMAISWMQTVNGILPEIEGVYALGANDLTVPPAQQP